MTGKLSHKTSISDNRYIDMVSRHIIMLSKNHMNHTFDVHIVDENRLKTGAN